MSSHLALISQSRDFDQSAIITTTRESWIVEQSVKKQLFIRTCHTEVTIVKNVKPNKQSGYLV